MMTSFVALFAVALLQLTTSVSAQASIDSQEGFDVGKNAGITIAIYVVTLLTVTLVINLLKRHVIDKANKKQPKMQIASQ
jgi:uncharacterized membrane protein